MSPEVRAELELLHRYARAVGRGVKRWPERTDLLDGGRGYLSGAMTTLLHLGLVTDEEHSEWSERLMAELPPADWIGG